MAKQAARQAGTKVLAPARRVLELAQPAPTAQPAPMIPLMDPARLNDILATVMSHPNAPKTLVNAVCATVAAQMRAWRGLDPLPSRRPKDRVEDEQEHGQEDQKMIEG